MIRVELPALTGDSPLGILAAMGALRLLTTFSDDAPLLSWDPGTLTAVLTSRRAGIGEVVTDLQRIVEGISEDSVLPGVAGGFPPPGPAPDRLRVPQMSLREACGGFLKGQTDAQGLEVFRWLGSLVTDLAADDKGRVAISQYTAPSGKQSSATMLEKPLELIRSEPEYLHQALVGWRRVADVTGEYLDGRAIWDAAQDGRGDSGGMRGVPGATWLALMSYALFRTTSISGKRPHSSGWHTVRLGSRTVDELRLPVWTQPLGVAAVTALVEHPALARPELKPDELGMLGVVHVCRARRYQTPGSKSAGVLTTIP